MILTDKKVFVLEEKLTEKVKNALLEVFSLDLLNLEEGKHKLSGDNFFLRLNYTTKEESECVWESHKKFIDVHCILSGTEKVCYQDIKKLELKTDYNEDGDYILYNGDGEKFILSENDIVVFFPEDGHVTGIMEDIPQEVKKIVLKVLY
ncbi:MAG: hypothetical protein A2725_01060 [Candidatus Magasanikbacteria bacterium RIFCSPHIGHO2_01_FULL_33_34]|uniref:YhcH/YjgK/YiaL family protein n=1 Tax=Candidatus Magasanikbacteria bacterium RIFCSPHIGHO2_01_FULL_33_34 TaxID=1798671 RepID=A0A1F6LJ17_9BACT|nr:MAG: hypothetical protein A2725_01060 [Candidatus Magasanikbacteria bacterium RIFCSPHIGHO2_01_FULL_33_34]OGH65344.1 MAG: hypothetical protein A3B83_04720 [Candidatus Magasanikbacteria bacterium RIFCSPHIGHO2_02_FULL_33_17]OGH76120.1 MAG: hypothetical protein A3A89_01640 [Candidatus Magasanikbacteria bacterium RIFCSPLOWO2_01_FULL_33_34]OGH81078.1 MAG: hypothetical protein A3F93_02860 [Candidatus Magasanikbacteria bacterium RIFCSPLOWO2_12_FULL_34_7]